MGEWNPPIALPSSSQLCKVLEVALMCSIRLTTVNQVDGPSAIVYKHQLELTWQQVLCACFVLQSSAGTACVAATSSFLLGFMHLLSHSEAMWVLGR